MKATRSEKTLDSLVIGARLLIRSKKDWRVAVVSKITSDKVALSVCSPTGRNYRLYRQPEAKIIFDGNIPILKFELSENWRQNFPKYDPRW